MQSESRVRRGSGLNVSATSIMPGMHAFCCLCATCSDRNTIVNQSPLPLSHSRCPSILIMCRGHLLYACSDREKVYGMGMKMSP